MNPEELNFWMQEYPDLDREEIIEIIEMLDSLEGTDEEQEEQPAPGSLEDRKNNMIDIEDYTKYW